MMTQSDRHPQAFEPGSSPARPLSRGPRANGRFVTLILAVVWLLVLGGSLAWNWRHVGASLTDLAETEAQLAEMLEKWLGKEEVDSRDHSHVDEPGSAGRPEGKTGEETVGNTGGEPGAAQGDDDLPVYDREQLLQRLSRNQELIQVIIQGFVEQNTERLKDLLQTISDGNLAAVRDQAHAIKGSALAVSANALAEMASRLERAGKDGDLAACKALGPQVEWEFQRLLAELGVMKPG